MSDNARPSTWMTWLLIALNVAMFGVEIASGADPLGPTSQQILRLGGDFAPLTLHGEWWRVGTSMFLHFGLMHIAMNMICLYQGRIVEMAYGHLGFLAIYLVSGLLGGVGSVAHHGNSVSAGASGAVFGVFGAFGAVLVMRRGQIDPKVWGTAARQLGTFIGINLVIGLQSDTIDVTAHIVGLIAGFVVGIVLLAGKRATAQRTRRSLAAIVLGIGLTAGGLAVVPEQPASAIMQLFEDFDDVQSASIETYNSKLADVKAGKLDESGFANMIEQQLLPRWQQMRARLDAFDGAKLSARLQEKLRLVRLYAKDREEAWKLLVTIDRSPNAGDDIKQQYRELEAATRDVIKQINALAPK